MKLKEEFVTILNEEGSITVSVDTKLFSGMIKGNPTAALVMSCLEQETDIGTIVDAICQEYEADPERVNEDVTKMIERLREIGAIDE